MLKILKVMLICVATLEPYKILVAHAFFMILSSYPQGGALNSSKLCKWCVLHNSFLLSARRSSQFR